MVPAPFSFSGKSETHGRVSARIVRKICTHGEESGKKIKAVSCKLTILLRFKSLRQASILNRTTCASSSF